MEGSQDTPLDEIQWRAPLLAQSMGGIHTNTVLPYFAKSPFFDPTSNNAILTTQATYNPAMFPILQTREAFEGRLKTMQGLEFVVANEHFEPQEEPLPVPAGRDNGVWIIRKQMRKKVHGEEDDLTVLATYFVVAESTNVYMAPSVKNILDSRVLSALSCLSKFLSEASSLPYFTPSLGYTYLPSAIKLQDTGANLQLSQTSKENTPMTDSQNTRSSRPFPKANFSDDIHSARLLTDSLRLSIQYENEYMDENPLVGEPGNFVLSKAPGKSGGVTDSQNRANAKSPAANAAQLKVNVAVDNSSTSGKKGNKSSDKGSKSPISPGSGKQKRRKSKNPSNESDMTVEK